MKPLLLACTVGLILPVTGISADVSRADIQAAIDKGIAWLENNQNENGSWSDDTHPALTALPVSAMAQNPATAGKPLSESAQKGVEFILSKQKSDGGIYGKGLATYNTAMSVTALSHVGNREHLPAIAKARRLLINQQQDFDKRGENDNLFDGGIGYGGSYAHSDLSNTHLALEALYYSKQALADTEFDETSEFDLDWESAIDFVSRCQNSEDTMKKLGDWAGLREEDKGGFIYFPGSTKSDEIELEGGKTALRSYGSMSYAGLLSFIYADMKESDPRVQAVLTWLGQNFVLDENPGMGAQGLYYYYHTLAKALSLAEKDELVLADGTKVDWKNDLAAKLIAVQKEDGSWTNGESNRWWEDDPALVTGYSLLALEHIAQAMGE